MFILIFNVINDNKYFKTILVEPPAPFVLLGTVSLVVVVVLVVGAELYSLVTGPL